MPRNIDALAYLIQFERWPSEYVLLHQNLSGVSILWGRGKMAANVECRIRYHTGYISQLFKTSKPRHSRVGNNELNGPYLYLFLYFRSIFDACEMSQIFMKSFGYLSAIPCTLHLMLNLLFSPLFSSNVGRKNARPKPARFFKFIYSDFITSTLRVLGRTCQH